MEEEGEPYHVRLLKVPCESSDEVSKWLCRLMNLPCGKGPEGRDDFESMVETDRCTFSKFNHAAQPPEERAPLAPMREDVTLIDLCSSQLSAEAQVLRWQRAKPHSLIRFTLRPICEFQQECETGLRLLQPDVQL